ncbi:cytochrome c peroxidase [Maricaulis parjimensis]|uniref:cytochrome c peroxidase n=1 Tax=Maricaulis parjimensis TaxID=144023 RepID=UPI00193A7853|nr:cytochrome c peroxidase [Maricaulis parjimensis]
MIWDRQAGSARAIAAAVTCVVLTACGGGGGSSNTDTGGGMTQQPNSAPVVNLANLDQAAEVGEAFTYDASQNGATFTDPDGDALSYAVTLTPNGSGLAAQGSVISGTPTAAFDVTATITASDPSGATASDSFTIFVDENQDVKALHGPSGLRFLEGRSVSFSADDWADLFENPSTNPLLLDLEVDGTIPGLTLTGNTLSGIPTQSGRWTGRITANNGAGEGAERAIQIVIVRTSTTGAPDLPAQAFDYVAYSETNLPLHFTDPAQGGNSVIATDNTPDDNPLTNAGATLGRVLFYDTRLSANNTVSCSSCHVQAFGFGEPSQFSTGFQGGLTDRNAPSLSNVRFYHNGRMFWDERAASLENQALVPIRNPVEMGNTLDAVVATVEGQAFYPPLFEAAFGDDEVTADRIARALAQFQRAIVSYQSRLDEAIIGDDPDVDDPDLAGRLTAQELHGMALFEPVDADILAAAGLGPVQTLGCDQCHRTAVQILSTAPNGAPGPQNIGLDASILGEGANGNDDFKVPSLRNVGISAPYMHDGRFDSLEDVINFYAQDVNDNGQTSRFLRQGDAANGAIQRFNLDEDEIDALVAFLNALTDEAVLNDPMFSDPFAD